MTRFKQHTTLNPDFVLRKLDEFFSEDHIENDITTQTTQQNCPNTTTTTTNKQSQNTNPTPTQI